METITRSELITRIRDDVEINFLAEAMTPLHVLGIEACILYLERRGVKCKGFIVAVNHAKTGKGLDESMFHTLCYSNVNPIYIKSEESKNANHLSFYLKLKKDKRKLNKLYYATPFTPSFDMIPLVMSARPEDDLQVFVTEEGTATYIANPYGLFYYTVFDPKFFQYPKIIWKNIIRNKFYLKRLCSAGKLTNFTFLSRENEKYVPNHECVEACKIILASETADTDYSYYENAVVFVPSLLYESGIISDRYDVELYKVAQDTIGNDCNYVVKPHPREKDLSAYSVLNCKIESNYKNSLESIIANLKIKPKCIIGDTGTSLVNIATLFGIKAISISKMIGDEHILFRGFFDKFNDTFSDIVFIPSTMTEFKDYLNNLVSTRDGENLK